MEFKHPKTPAAKATAMATRKRAMTPSRDAGRKASRDERDSLEVLCRLSPYDGQYPSVVVVDQNTLRTNAPPQEYRRDAAVNDKAYSFGQIFQMNTSQSEVFQKSAKDLIGNLMLGKNSLLFTYGVTGSGKTYTMTGSPDNIGLLPRTLDTVFNSIKNKTLKCVFYPMGANQYGTRNSLEAHLTRNRLISNMDSSREMLDRVFEETKVEGYHPDFVCSVFVSYIEIYNNQCYDLTQERTSDHKLRTDQNGQIYVEGVEEIEVENSEEALAVFCKGQERRSKSATVLNKDSSRSHSVFTIKLVMAPRRADAKVDVPVEDPSSVIVANLCLVDLAGSERAKRTQNHGDRLVEANNINKSLLNLRQCLDVLRRNQKRSVPEPVPYRDTKLTHLFKNFLEGNGKIRMIICVNPKPEDYAENLSVLGFAEESQLVEVKRQMTRVVSDALPGAFIAQWTEEWEKKWPKYKSRAKTMPSMPSSDASLDDWQNYTESFNKAIGKMMQADEISRVTAMERDYYQLLVREQKELLEKKDDQIETMKKQLAKLKRENASLNARIVAVEADREDIQDHMDHLRSENAKDRRVIESQKRAMKQVQGIFDHSTPTVASLRSRFDKENTPKGTGAAIKTDPLHTPATSSSSNMKYRTPGGNGFMDPKYGRRSKSAPRILDHQPMHRVPTGSVMHVRTPSNAIRTTKPMLRQLNRSSDYRLTHQEVDEDGNISTNVVKGHCIPTAGGGSAVVFDDIECLHHDSPARH